VPPLRPRPEPVEIDFSALFGPKALAIAGGVVTLLGVVFFFILAVDRGWVGPVGRVALGGSASTLLFLTGLELRRRFGTTHAALAAVGSGIAGAYATLLAATVLYHLIPPGAALVVAAGIAATGLATALAWRSELVAGLGLIGALLAPAALALQGGITAVGTAFAALVLAATAAVAIRRSWRGLLVAGIAASAPQIAALVLLPANHGTAPAAVVADAAVFALLYLAAAIANQLVAKGRLAGMTSGLVLGSGVLAVGSSYRLFATPTAQGLALLAVTLVYVAASVALYRRRDLGSLIAAAAFTAGALSVAALLSGDPLTYAWAAESAAIAWLASRTKEIRFRLWSTVYAALALGHALAVDAPVRALMTEAAASASGAPAVLAVAAALVAYVWFERTWPESTGELDATVAELDPFLTTAARWLAGILTAYGASLAIVGVSPSFDWAHVGVAALWSLTGLGILAVAIRHGSTQALIGGEIWLGTTAVVTGVHAAFFAETPRACVLAVAGASLLVGALVVELRPGRKGRIDLVAAAGAVLAQVALWIASASVLHTQHGFGVAVMALGALDAAIAAVLFRRQGERDFVTVLWGAGAFLVAVAVPLLLDGTPVTLAWAAGVATFAALLALTGEKALSRRRRGLRRPGARSHADARRAGFPPVRGRRAENRRPRRAGSRGRRRRRRSRHEVQVGRRRGRRCRRLRALDRGPRPDGRGLPPDRSGRGLPHRPHARERVLGPARARAPLRRAQALRRAPGRRARGLRGGARKALPVRPQLPQLDHAGPVVPRGRGGAARRRLLLPAPHGYAPLRP
jgi:hypothetical protein